jgi:mono/diheme cytochrome c family protein
MRSPLAPSAASVAAGRAIYLERCLPCHGPRGRGDGPAGVTLDPRPADLLLHVPQHTDGELFYFVSRGIPGSAMPAWRAALSETERWQVVQYLREIGRGAP